MDLVVDFAESSSTVEVPMAPRSSIEIHNSLTIRRHSYFSAISTLVKTANKLRL